jgi:hypothetical protein
MKPLGLTRSKNFGLFVKASRGREQRLFGPLNQCDHRRMRTCCPGCGHWACPDCGLSYDARAGR